MRPSNQRRAGSPSGTSSRMFWPNRKRSLVGKSSIVQAAPERGPRQAVIAASVFSCARIGTSANTALPEVWSRWQWVLTTMRSGWPVFASTAARNWRASRGYCWVSMTITPSGVSIAPALESPPAPIQAWTPSATVTRWASLLFCSVITILLSAIRRALTALFELGRPHQIRDLFLGKRGAEEFVLYRLGHDLVDPDDRIGRQAVLRHELAHPPHHRLGHAGELAVMLERGRIGIHPFDGFLVGAVEANERVLAVGQRRQIGDIDAARPGAQRRHVIAARHDAGPAVLDHIEPERDRPEADIDLARHGLGDGGRDAAGRGRLELAIVLRRQRQQRGMARRAGERIGHGLAVEILDLLDGRIGRNVPEQVRRADDLAADDADRRAFREGAEGGRHAGGGRDVDAARDQCLDRFRPGRGIEDFKLQPVLLEDAAAQPELGNAGVP